MTEKEFREKLLAGLANACLSEQQRDSILHAALNPQEQQKPRRCIRPAAVIVLAVIVLSLATAGAAGTMRMIGWQGQEVTPVPVPSITSIVGDMYRILSEGDSAYARIVSQQFNGAYRCVFDDPSESYNSLDALEQTVNMQQLLPWVTEVCEGYELERGYLHYDCQWPGEFTVISETLHESGATVRELSIPEEHRLLSNYRLSMQKGNGCFLTIDVCLQHESARGMFSVTGEEKAEVLSVAGMDDGLFIASAGQNVLAMRRKLPERISFRIPDIHAFTGKFESAVSHYGYVYIEITTNDPALGKHDLFRLFGLTEKPE